MLNFFKNNILYNNDGYNGFVTILFTAILMTLFEVVFFMNIGLKDISLSLMHLKNKLKINLDSNLLGNQKYCNYLYNTTRTKHSDEIFDKHCQNFKKKHINNENNDEINEFILKLKQSTQINSVLGGAASVLYGVDIKSQVENIESILKSVTDISDPEILISSLYDYYRQHPEFAKGNSVIKELLKNKFNTEVNNNAWELLIFITTILITIIFMFKTAPNSNGFSAKRVLWNFAFITSGIIAFQIYFYYNVGTQYEFEGNELAELIDFYKKSVKK
jgi:hypothetical protein